MSTRVYNITILQGTTFTRTFTFTHAITLCEDLVPSTTSPPTTLLVKSLPVDLAAGTIIDIELDSCTLVQLELSAAASVGDRILNIVPYTGTTRVRKNRVVPVAPIDLTGLTWRASLRDASTDTELLDFTFNIPDPTQGVVEVIGDAVSTAALTPNASFFEIPIFYPTPLSVQLQENFEDQAIWESAYFWDLESEDGSGVVVRRVYGRAWVVTEYTR